MVAYVTVFSPQDAGYIQQELQELNPGLDVRPTLGPPGGRWKSGHGWEVFPKPGHEDLDVVFWLSELEFGTHGLFAWANSPFDPRFGEFRFIDQDTGDIGRTPASDLVETTGHVRAREPVVRPQWVQDAASAVSTDEGMDAVHIAVHGYDDFEIQKATYDLVADELSKWARRNGFTVVRQTRNPRTKAEYVAGGWSAYWPVNKGGELELKDKLLEDLDEEAQMFIAVQSGDLEPAKEWLAIDDGEWTDVKPAALKEFVKEVKKKAAPKKAKKKAGGKTKKKKKSASKEMGVPTKKKSKKKSGKKKTGAKKKASAKKKSATKQVETCRVSSPKSLHELVGSPFSYKRTKAQDELFSATRKGATVPVKVVERALQSYKTQAKRPGKTADSKAKKAHAKMLAELLAADLKKHKKK